MADMDLQIKIDASTEAAVKSVRSLRDSIRELGRQVREAGVSGSLAAIGTAVQNLGQGLQTFERHAKQFGRDLATYVTAPIAALAGLSLKKIFDEAFEGRGNENMLRFGAAVQSLKRAFDELLITLGERLAPTATRIAVQIRGLVRAFNELDESTQNTVIKLSLFAAALGPVIYTGSIAAGMLGKVASALGVIAKALGAALVAINPFVAAIAAAVAALSVGIGGTINLFLQLKKTGLETKDALSLAFELIGGALNKYLYAPLLRVYSWLLKLQNLAGKAIDSVLGTSLSESTQAAVDSALSIVDSLNRSFEDKKEELDEKLASIGSSTANAYTFGFLNRFNEFKDQITSVLSGPVEDVGSTMWTKFDEDAEQASRSIRLSLSRGVADSLLQVADGAKSAGEAFRDFARNTVRWLTQMVLQAQIFRALFPDGGAADGIGRIIGGMSSIPGAATGGYVSGPGTSTSDSILARLSDGEFVSDAKTVRYFGPEFFHNLKKMAGGAFRRPKSGSVIQGFASGGAVSAGSGSGSAPQVVIENRGAPKEATGASFDPSTAVTTVILEDLSKNGPVSRGISSAYGIKRGGYR